MAQLITYPELPKNKYRVGKTKSGKSWISWPAGKKKQGKIFSTWDEAINWATLQSFVLGIMRESNG